MVQPHRHARFGPGNANFPIGVLEIANREIGAPRVSTTAFVLLLSQLCGFRHATIANGDD